ncbi:MAG TPA: hypothetical protein RMH99_09595 [Sandaracinaceae bacterium LLY-WYZ-13_1]|nr:hypothetical protein [Sandaracinaceae bacterium LLY-WYZ-13_1]
MASPPFRRWAGCYTTPVRVVLLPGMDGTDRLLGPFRSALQTPSEVVVYPPDEVLGYAALEARVRERLRAPAVVVAESFSGPLAIRLARSPARVAGLVLVATFAAPPAPAWLGRLVRPTLFRRSPPRAVLRRLFFERTTPDARVDALREAIASVQPRVLSARVRATLAVDVRDALAQLACPVLDLEGARDRLVRRPLAPLPAGAERHVLDAPHLVLQSRAEAAARLVDDFVRRL